MSAQFFQSTTPSEAQFLKCNDLTVRGAVIANESVSVAGNLSTNGTLGFGPHPSDGAKSGEITLPTSNKQYR